ncbi:hypothetical protein LCGC14_2690360 [marine sediment metagenome]|uniref:SWIM-type domain-containing protein n=1 Tax=marine sediment metagenome TaxID=412755 RepID=A0A0F9CAE1_9ZZZZ
MNSDDKAKRYYTEGKVFPLRDTSLAELWCVEGDSGVWNIRYDKKKSIYLCNCKNIRNTQCSHIKAVMIQKGENSEEKV